MRTKINLILGALIALFSGCKSPKDIPLQSEKVMVLYGPPAVFHEQVKDTIKNDDRRTPPNTFQQNKVERPDNSKSL